VEDTVAGRNPPRHVYSEYHGLDHGLWYSGYAKYDGLVDWLFSFSKQDATTAIRRPVRGSGNRNGVGYRKGSLLYNPAGRRVGLLGRK
jgi:hypothetical protein